MTSWTPNPVRAGTTVPPAQAVTVLLAGPAQRVNSWYAALLTDPRFNVASRAIEPEDLQSKLAANPDILLLDASILPGPKELIQLLTRVPHAAYVLLPVQGGDPQTVAMVRQVPAVRDVFVGDVSLPTLVGRMYGDAIALRQSAHPGADTAVWTPTGERGGVPTGLRVIAVWNQMGGVGKTTIATNLAYEAARRGLPTLLVGLGAPDDLPLILGLRAEPNLTHWRANPTEAGFKSALQKLDDLHVLAGFPDMVTDKELLDEPLTAPASIPELARAAAYAGYAVIVLDTPDNALAGPALSAANNLVLAARPSLEGIMRSAVAYRTVVERMAGQHRIPATGVHVVLCRTGNRMDAGEWHKAASAQIGRSFPPVVAQIPEDPQVGQAQDQRKLPLVASDTFARALKPLADTLLALPAASNNGHAPKKKVINLGPIKVKV